MVFAGDMNGHIGSIVMLAMMVVSDTALGTLMVPGYYSLQLG